MTSIERGAAETADWLLTPEAIRAQCGALYAEAEAGRLAHFSLHAERLDACAAEVVATIRAAYPDLQVPPHARWRHFVLGGRDRWGEAAAGLDLDPMERARIECELAVVSVLLDAGAGPAWRYRDPADGAVFARSEGLALASLHLFLAGAFGGAASGASGGRGPGTSAAGLMAVDAAALARGLQVSADNPLEGLEGRAALIADLGRVVAARTDVFGTPPRLGAIVDYLARGGGPVPARDILCTVLDVLGPVWPGRPALAGRVLGDCWPHPAAPAPGLVPLHKLSQWLSYSLIEPLQRAGIAVTDLDALTGLAEYRNGGLFLDTGVLALKDPAATAVAHAPESALIVEWRALTVALLDRVAGSFNG